MWWLHIQEFDPPGESLEGHLSSLQTSEEGINIVSVLSTICSMIHSTKRCLQTTVMAFADDKSSFITTSDDGTVSVNVHNNVDAMDIDDDNIDGVVSKSSRKLGIIPPCGGTGFMYGFGFPPHCTRGPILLI